MEQKPRWVIEARRVAPYYLFILPALAIYTLFGAYPILQSFWYSLLDWTGGPHPAFVGLGQYGSLLSDTRFWGDLFNSMVWTVGTFVLTVCGGFLIALALNEHIPLRSAFRSVYFFPTMLSLVVVGILWREIYDPTIGLLNSLLQAIGLGSVAQPWLAQASTARPALIVAASWQSFGYNMVLFLAGLQQVPADIHEAAMIDGATYWQRVGHVTLPLLREVFTIICILTFIGSFRAFDVIYATTTGGPNFATETLAYYVYQIGFFLSNNFGYASTIAVVLFAIIFIPSLFWIRLQTREVQLGA